MFNSTFRLLVLTGLVAHGCARSAGTLDRSAEPSGAGDRSLQLEGEGQGFLQYHSRGLKQEASPDGSGDPDPRPVQGAAAVGGPSMSDPSVYGNSVDLFTVPRPFILTGNEYFTVTSDNLEFIDLVPADSLVNIYSIYYGNWGVDQDLQPLNDSSQVLAAQAIPTIEKFLAGIGTSDWWNITRAYCMDGVPNDPTQTTGGCAGIPVHDVDNSHHFTADPASVGIKLTDSSSKQLIVNKINSGDVAYDPYGMYVIFVSPEISYSGSAEAPGDFCTKSCGYHSAIELTETDLEDGEVVRAPGAPRTTNPEAQATVETTFAVPYAIVGNPGVACDGCQAAYSSPPFGEPNSFLPNSNVEADAIVSILAHELTEAFTDPQFVIGTTTYYGFGDRYHLANSAAGSNENADKCANNWYLPQYSVSENGKYYTNMVSGTPYIIQQNWLPVLSTPGKPGQVGCVSSVPAGYIGKTYLSDPNTGVQPNPPAPEEATSPPTAPTSPPEAPTSPPEEPASPPEEPTSPPESPSEKPAS